MVFCCFPSPLKKHVKDVLSSILYQLQGLDLLWKENLSGLTYDFMFLNVTECNCITLIWWDLAIYKQADKHIQIWSNWSINLWRLLAFEGGQGKKLGLIPTSQPQSWIPKSAKMELSCSLKETQNSNIQQTWWE
jgi:hypothetical protein